MLILASLAAAQTGCASLSLERARLERVKRVAVIGYSASVELGQSRRRRARPDDVRDRITTTNQLERLSPIATVQERARQATSTYDLLVRRLAEGTGWAVIGRAVLTQDAAYQAAYEEHHATASAFTTDVEPVRAVPQLLKAFSAQTMSEADRRALMDALKIDALAAVRVRFLDGGGSGLGLGTTGKAALHPKAVVDIMVWDRSGGEPIWHDRHAEGEAASAGAVVTMGVVDESTLLPGLEESADSAYRVMLKRFRSGE